MSAWDPIIKPINRPKYPLFYTAKGVGENGKRQKAGPTVGK